MTTGRMVISEIKEKENTVRESATPGCKENKQANAGSHLFSTPCAARCCVIVHRQGVEVYLHRTCTTTGGMFSRTLYVQHPVTKNLHISSRFSPTIFYCKFSTPTSTPLYSSIKLMGSMRRTLCSKLFMMRA